MQSQEKRIADQREREGVREMLVVEREGKESLEEVGRIK